MFCSNCGTKVSDGSSVCPNCRTSLKSPFAPASSLSAAPSLDSSPAPESPFAPPAAPSFTPNPAPPAAPSFTAPAAAPAFAPDPAPAAAPAAPAVAPMAGGIKRISAGRELKLLLRQGWLVLVGDMRNLIFSLLFPVVAALVTVLVAGKDMFVTYEGTKSTCFILVCAAIWGGLFNSIQTLVKERSNIKRDYVSGALRLECYMTSRAILQLLLCLVQSAILTISIPAMDWVHGNPFPAEGLLIPVTLLEYFLTLFLVMFGADTMGLMISSVVKKAELASTLAPYILIAQLLFSGMLFKMEGFASAFSAIMLSRWGMEALGSTSNLNDLPLKVTKEMEDPMLIAAIPRETEEAFEASSEHVLLVLALLLVFVIVPLVVGDIMLHRVKKDSRD
ncbi:MAG: ABC transporter permease [Oscillospiraceae bacterium]|nr:ABC transporter permease [Oscillospiraceae bacterium]